jgi:hypothetical protein
MAGLSVSAVRAADRAREAGLGARAGMNILGRQLAAQEDRGAFRCCSDGPAERGSRRDQRESIAR